MSSSTLNGIESERAMLERPKARLALKIFPFLMLLAGAAKFYHFNYVEHYENAKNLRLEGLQSFVCKGVPYDITTESCGTISIYGEADWGVTAYLVVFGVDSKEEAQTIANFMISARSKSHQEHIPMHLEVYSNPRGSGPPKRLNANKIFDQSL
jgi:hypothetical protein